MAKCAFLFPGQGAQYVGMGQDLAAAYPEAAAVFHEADEVLGFGLSRTIIICRLYMPVRKALRAK